MNLYRSTQMIVSMLQPKRVFVVALLLIFSPIVAFAQQNADGSAYSRFGIGELFSYSTSQIQALGGGGTALTSFNYVNLSNPATWADQSLTRLTTGVQFQGIELSNGSGNESRLNSSMLQAFQFSFPIRRGKLGASIAFTPYSRVAHTVPQEPVSIQGELQDPTSYVINFEGQGGIQQATIGLGFRPASRVSFGLSANFLFGIIEEVRRTEVFSDDGATDPLLSFSQTIFNKETKLSGFTSTAGALVTLPGVLSDKDALSIGASISFPTSLTGTRSRTFGTDPDQLETIGDETKGDIDLPLRTNLGLSYHPNRSWIILADLTLEPWSSFDSELDLPGFVPQGASSFKDRTRFSLGVDFQPSSNVLDSYFRRVALRFGYYYDTGYIDVVQNTSVNTSAFTGGVSLPTLFPGTRIDLNLEVGRRGMTDFGLVRETFYKIHINVNIGERWFERRKLG
ncbi:MAG: outer membrane protein transport protein [Rhodothermaceae bacterium]|nr:outer membrane protein transport protein [Rhodothermaceae bacterium]